MAEDDERQREWDRAADEAKTTLDAVPLPVADEAKTPRPEHTGKHTLTPAQFASAIDLTDRDAFARGVEHGRALAKADAEAGAVTEHRKVREDGVEAFRAFYVIWAGTWPATWEEAEAWYRSRLTPL
jgi:hypothetical protein